MNTKPSSADPGVRRRERAIWGSITVVLIAALLVLAVTPSVFAQRYDDAERAVDVFETVLRFIEENYVDEIDVDQLLEGALEGMFESLDDRNSSYLDASEYRGLNDDITGEFGGVGMYISKEDTDADDESAGYVEVVAPIEDTPAFRAGIRAGDLILSVQDAEEDEFTSTEGLSLDEVVDRLRGRPGTEVTIQIRRGSRAQFPVTLERSIIETPTVKFEMIPGNIGFLRVIQFTSRTPERVEDAVAFFEENGYESMIIDLRSNPGGVLSAVVDVADFFFERGTIVGTSGRIPEENERFTANRGSIVDSDLPIVVLVDRGSASASEILAGTLQDRGRATVIGETTYGKGSVQTVRRIGQGGFRLTTSRYYLPSGRYIDEIGIDPNIEVSETELTDEENEEFADLVVSERIPLWVEGNRNPSDSEVDRFVDTLQSDGFEVPDRWIELTIRNEVNRQNNVQIVYDLEFDEVLREAIRLIESGEVSVR